MAAISWKTAVSADWSIATDWSAGTAPGSGDAVTIAIATRYTVTIGVAPEAANTLTLNSATASLQVDSTLTMGGALTLTAGTVDLVGVIKGGSLVLNGGSFVPGGGTLEGVKVQGTLALTQSFGPALVVQGGMTLANLAETGGGLLNLIGPGASLSLAPGVQGLGSTVAGQTSTIDIGSASGDTIGERNAGGTITSASFGPLIDIVQAGRSATLTASGQAGDSMVNDGLITAAVRNGSFAITGGMFFNNGAITVNNGDTVTINSSSFSNSGAINVLDTGTLNIGQFGTWSSTGSITETDATVNLLGTVTTAELKAITSRVGGQVDLAGSLALGGGTLNVGTGTTLGELLLTGVIANGTVHDAGLGMQFGANSSAGSSFNGVVYEGVLDLSEPSAHLTVQNAFSVTGTGGTGVGTINLTGNDGNLTLVGSRTLGNATLRIGNASISIDNPGTTTAVTFGGALTIRQGGVGGVSSSITGTGQIADSLLNDGGIFGSLQGGQFTISGVGSFTNAGSIGFNNGNDLTINAGSLTNQTSIALGSGLTAVFDGTIGFNNPGVISAGYDDAVSISAPAVTDAGSMSIGAGSTLSIGSFTSFANAGSLGIAAGATLDIGSSSAAWSSTGTITATGATVNLQGIVTPGQIGAITRVGGAGVIDITGMLNDTGATLNVGTGSAFGSLELSGTITGGTIHDAGGGLMFVGTTPVLDGVTYQGVVDLSESDARVEVLDGITLAGTAGSGAGTVNLTGSGASMLFTGSATVGNATINLGATLGSASGWFGGGPTLLTFGPKLVVQQAGRLAVLQGPTNDTDMLINRGAIDAGFSGGSMTISGNLFSNLGTVTVSNGDLLDITGSSFINAGTVNVLTGATLEVGSGGDWISTGHVNETAATVLLEGDVTLPELMSITRSGGMLVIGGRFDNLGSTLKVGTGSTLGDLVLAGTIDDGIINDAGGGLVFQNATLENVAYQGTVNLSTSGASLTVLGALTPNDVTGTLAGTVNLTGAGGELTLQEPQAFGDATVDIGSAAGDTIKVVEPFFGGGSSATTLGKKLDIVQSGSSATLAGSTGSTDILNNQGTIGAGFAGGTFTISGNDFDNAGIIAVSHGEVLNMTAAAFSNTGTVTVTTGGVLNLGTALEFGFGNYGILSETNAAINLAGPVTLANLNSITRSGGTVTLAGTADLGGGTLNVGTGSALGALAVTGQIQNGTVHDAGTGLEFTAGGSIGAAGTLSDVAYHGTLDLSEAQSNVTLVGTSAFAALTGTAPGTIKLTGPGSTMTVLGSTTLDNANLSLGGAALTASPITGTSDGEFAPSPANLTLGPKFSITHTASSNGTDGLSTISSTAGFGFGGTPGTITNLGTITAGLAGGSLTISGTGFTNGKLLAVANGDAVSVIASSFTNSGTVTVNAASLLIGAAFSSSGFTNSGTLAVTGGGTLTLGATSSTLTWTSTGKLSETGSAINLYGPVTLGNLNSITRSGGTITLAGAGNLGGGTLNVGGTSALGALVLTGAIQNGTINDAGGGFVLQNATLENVTYQGTVNLSTSGATLTVLGALTPTAVTGTSPGTVTLTGAGSELTLQEPQAFGNARVDIGSTAGDTIKVVEPLSGGGSWTTTLGKKLDIVQTGSSATLAGSTGSTDILNNQGTIAAGFAGGAFTISGNDFLNAGSITVSNGEVLNMTAASFSNNGTVTVTTGGVLNIGQAFNGSTWSSTGKLSETNATINLFSTVTLADLNAITRSGGTINFQGTMTGGGGMLNVGAGSVLGSVQDTGTISSTIVHDAGNGLLCFGPMLSSGGVGAMLSGDTYEGTMNLSSTLATLTIVNGILAEGVGGSGAGLVNLTGDQAVLNAQGAETLNNMTINLGNAAPLGSTLNQTDPAALSAVLTLGSGLTINQAGGYANIVGARNLGDRIVNDGTINANLAGGQLLITQGAFTNAGSITVGNGDTMTVSTDAPFANNGVVALSDGSAEVSAPVDPASTGVFTLANHSLLELAADTGAGNKMSFLSGSELAVGAVEQFGTNIGLASYTGPLLEGFGVGDQIDLKDLVFAGATIDSYTAASGLLQLNGGTTKATLLFQNSSLGSGAFHIANDGNGEVLLTHS